jgi:hypothetical protein
MPITPEYHRVRPVSSFLQTALSKVPRLQPLSAISPLLASSRRGTPDRVLRFWRVTMLAAVNLLRSSAAGQNSPARLTSMRSQEQ